MYFHGNPIEFSGELIKICYFTSNLERIFNTCLKQVQNFHFDFNFLVDYFYTAIFLLRETQYVEN